MKEYKFGGLSTAQGKEGAYIVLLDPEEQIQVINADQETTLENKSVVVHLAESEVQTLLTHLQNRKVN